MIFNDHFIKPFDQCWIIQTLHAIEINGDFTSCISVFFFCVVF